MLNDAAMLFDSFGSERKARLDGGKGSTRDARSEVLADGRTMLKTVAGAAAREPDILEAGMEIDEKVAVRGVFVLAHACFDYGSGGEVWKALGKIGAHFVHTVRRDHTVVEIGIDRRAVAVGGEFEAATSETGEAVHAVAEAKVEPDGELGRLETEIAGRNAEK